jgi:hypothetical protein
LKKQPLETVSPKTYTVIRKQKTPSNIADLSKPHSEGDVIKTGETSHSATVMAESTGN